MNWWRFRLLRLICLVLESSAVHHVGNVLARLELYFLAQLAKELELPAALVQKRLIIKLAECLRIIQ